ncbi:MAG: T9SS type A sorting domain-containing protein [Bacteroidota bacterium]|jgi:hypothetical protein
MIRSYAIIPFFAMTILQMLHAQTPTISENITQIDNGAVSMYCPLDTLRDFVYLKTTGVLQGSRLRMKIGQPRLAFGKTWYRMYEEGSHLPMQAWYRNDIDGLHILQDSLGKWLTDRICLPAVVKKGDVFLGGRVSETGTVDCNGVIRKTATVNFEPFSAITWIDSIGILEVTKGNESCFLIATDGYRSDLNDPHPPEFEIPFMPGDVLVYSAVPEPESGDVTLVATRSHTRNSTFRVDRWTVIDGDYGYVLTDWVYSSVGYYFEIDTMGCVTVNDTRLAQTSCQLYPAYIPRGRQVMLNYVEWDVSRLIDTTVFGVPTRGYELVKDGWQRRVITERFGEIFHNGLMLISAVVRDTMFNRDTTQRQYLPLCVGNRYVYHRQFPDMRIDRDVVMTVTADSILDGRQYFHLEGEGPLSGWYRSDPTGVYRYRSEGEVRVVQGNASLGSLNANGMVVDTATVTGLSKPRFSITMYENVTVAKSSYDWLEGVGLTNKYFWGNASGSDEYNLVSAVVCGEEYGTPTLTESAASLPDTPAISAVYPHPIAELGTVEFILPQACHVRLELTDMLGRQVMLLQDTEMPAGTHHALFNKTEAPAGLYILWLRTPGHIVTDKLLVR